MEASPPLRGLLAVCPCRRARQGELCDRDWVSGFCPTLAVTLTFMEATFDAFHHASGGWMPEAHCQRDDTERRRDMNVIRADEFGSDPSRRTRRDLERINERAQLGRAEL